MARLFHTGFESGSVAADAALFGYTLNNGFTGTWITSGQRTGNSCLALPSVGDSYLFSSGATSQTNTYYVRLACKTLATCSGSFFGLTDASYMGIEIDFDGEGNITFLNNSARTPPTSTPTSVPFSNGVWHVLEMSWVPNTGAFVVRLDGTQVATGTSEISGATGIQSYIWGEIGSNCLVDDWALNDSTGTAGNSWCGEGGIVLCLPELATLDDTGWTNGIGGTTGLYLAVNNLPPVGVALASATATSQIKDVNSNTTDTYLPTLNTSVIPAGSSIVLAQVVASIGNSTTTSRDIGLSSASNPSISESVASSGSTAAGPWPTGWTTLNTAIDYAPSVALESPTQLQIRKATASTDAAMCCFMGLTTEYLPGATPVGDGGFFLAQ